MTRLLQWLKIALDWILAITLPVAFLSIFYFALTYKPAPKIGPPYASYYTRCKAKGGVFIENYHYNQACVKLERVLPDE